MRLSGAALLLALTWATAIHAADVTPASRIVGVMVFPSGAEVTRIATVRLQPGEHTLLFAHLPAQAVAGSIRVEGKATGRLDIGAVDTRRMLVQRTDPAQVASERRALELEIEGLRDERASIEADVKAASTQLALIDKLTELPVHPGPAGPQPAGGLPDWGQVFALIGQRSAEAQRASLSAQVKGRQVDRKIEDLQKKLASLAPGQEERTEVKVFVAAGVALEGELTLRYQVLNASWRPYYDARLTTGSRDVAPKLGLVRRASIQQRTGEDWKDVALELSTTRPGSGTAAPDLRPMTVDFEPEALPPRPVASAPAAPLARGKRSPGEQDVDVRSAADAKENRADKMDVAQELQATVQAAPFQAVFGVPGKLTVLATGEQKRVQIDEATLDPVLMVRTVPRVEAKAFLYAKLTLPKTTAYLPGQVSLFRDGTFVGTGRLPLLAAGEEHDLGFGQDDSVRVRHALVEEKRSEQGIISSSKADQRSYRITVKNLHERGIGVVILDQFPVSQNQDIKVELTGKQPPSRRDIEDKRGVIAWDLKLEPQQEQAIEFGWRTQWPSNKRVQYAR